MRSALSLSSAQSKSFRERCTLTGVFQRPSLNDHLYLAAYYEGSTNRFILYRTYLKNISSPDAMFANSHSSPHAFNQLDSVFVFDTLLSEISKRSIKGPY